MDTITGVLENIVYHNDGFLIGTIGLTSNNRQASVKGNMLYPSVGMRYVFEGKWETHPRFGSQFAFQKYRGELPIDRQAISKYLRTNAKWVGPVISTRLIDAYGDDALRMCKEEPDRVADEIQGVSVDHAHRIATMLRENENQEKLQIELTTLFTDTGVSQKSINAIIERWKHQAPAVIKANPYELIKEIDGIGFVAADQIARNCGIGFDDPARIRAALVYTLREKAWGNGDCYLPRRDLINATSSLIGVTELYIDRQVDGCINDGTLISVPATSKPRPDAMYYNGDEAKPVIWSVGGDCTVPSEIVYLPELYADEQYVADKLSALLLYEHEPVEPYIEGLQDDQVQAVTAAANHGVMVLTGAPGTGKTYTVSRIIKTFMPDDTEKKTSVRSISLAAPTGKAAKRIMEQTGRAAVTIHQLLGPSFINGRFKFQHDEKFPLSTDLIVIDETSMVDISLMASFLKAVKVGTRLIFVGDTYQLPSVGPGNVLKDMISSGIIPSVELTIIKRQGEGLIVNNCHKIKAGQDITVDNDNSTDFFFIPCEQEETIQNTIKELCVSRLPESYQVDRLKDIQVISPLREKTDLGCKALNDVLQEALNPGKSFKGTKFRVGDKVIQTKNDYSLGAINGDIGYVKDIDLQGKKIIVDFEAPDREIEIPLIGNDLQLAYAITCHKFQGSETPIAVIPIHKSLSPMVCQRNWLYTAISRAKKVCILIGHYAEVGKIIRRNRQQARNTSLNRVLREYYEQYKSGHGTESVNNTTETETSGGPPETQRMADCDRHAGATAI